MGKNKCDIAVPGNRVCEVAIEWLIRASWIEKNGKIKFHLFILIIFTNYTILKQNDRNFYTKNSFTLHSLQLKARAKIREDNQLIDKDGWQTLRAKMDKNTFQSIPLLRLTGVGWGQISHNSIKMTSLWKLSYHWASINSLCALPLFTLQSESRKLLVILMESANHFLAFPKPLPEYFTAKLSFTLGGEGGYSKQVHLGHYIPVPWGNHRW